MHVMENEISDKGRKMLVKMGSGDFSSSGASNCKAKRFNDGLITVFGSFCIRGGTANITNLIVG